ncbi:MAG: metal-sulfur cluster assembly factor [Anaerolineales bacterium]|nr:metal-sulfur cluster assembly factor [Anaerolineales bacterium]
MTEPEVSQDEVKKAIRDALLNVYDPEIGMSVVELGMIRDIAVDKEPVQIQMILTTPFCPLAGLIVSQVQKAAEAAAGRPVQVTMGTEAWDPSMICREQD